MSGNILNELTQEIRTFADFQWLTPEESMGNALSSDQKKSIALEIADVQIYLLRMADVLGIDVSEVVREKIKINETRF
jgi:NTP pyrophosphatase (non-canonical NTP hydrolase)